ncbi:hypothetical protein LCM4573_15790 [Rhizobium sp. LCM 4573]|nr:hypothetical protein LCM4573_15790 [Rhizobium sp. LCM 4573]
MKMTAYFEFAPHPNPLPARGERGRAMLGLDDLGNAMPLAPFSPPAGRRCRQADEGQDFRAGGNL